MPDLLNQKATADLLGIDRTTVHRLTKLDPTFPPPARLGPKTLRWRRDELERWIDAKQRPAAIATRAVRV